MACAPIIVSFSVHHDPVEAISEVIALESFDAVLLDLPRGRISHRFHQELRCLAPLQMPVASIRHSRSRHHMNWKPAAPTSGSASPR
jgi:hypothetical protein